MDLVGAPVVVAVLGALRALANTGRYLSVRERPRVMLVKPVWALVLFKYAIV